MFAFASAMPLRQTWPFRRSAKQISPSQSSAAPP